MRIWLNPSASTSISEGTASSAAAATMVVLRPSRSASMPMKGADPATARVEMPTMVPALAAEM